MHIHASMIYMYTWMCTMCVYLYVYMFIGRHTWAYVCEYLNICYRNKFACRHLYICWYTYINTYIHIYVICVCMYIHTYIHICLHA